MGNQFRTAILLTVLTVFIMIVGQLLGGRQGMIIALIFAGGMNFHGPQEWISTRALALSACTLLNLVQLWESPEGTRASSSIASEG